MLVMSQGAYYETEGGCRERPRHQDVYPSNQHGTHMGNISQKSNLGTSAAVTNFKHVGKLEEVRGAS